MNTLTPVRLDYDGFSESVGEELPSPVCFLHHMVTDTLAGHEARNVDVCILNRSVGFPTKLSNTAGSSD